MTQDLRTVELDTIEWQQVISALAMTNPLLVKISTQLSQQQQQARDAETDDRRQSFMHPGNSKEPRHGL